MGEAMLINQSLDGQAMDGMVASKSIESSDLNLNDLEQLNPDLTDYRLSNSMSGSNRDSNATHKTDMSSRRGSLNRLIQIAKLAQIQRFYQFKLDEEEVERLMFAFLDTFYAEQRHANLVNLSAVTF